MWEKKVRLGSSAPLYSCEIANDFLDLLDAEVGLCNYY